MGDRPRPGRVPFRRLSAPFRAAALDLHARVDAAAAAAAAGAPDNLWESDELLAVRAAAAGSWNAVAVWFEARARPYPTPALLRGCARGSAARVRRARGAARAGSACARGTATPHTRRAVGLFAPARSHGRHDGGRPERGRARRLLMARLRGWRA